MTTVISVENLSKSYRLGQIGTGTFAYDLNVWWARLRGKPNPLARIGETDHGNRVGEEVWALKDVSFQVQQGEVLGIIGRNGAGKSTLLKILSRVTAPTSGEIKVKGRVASLLEVGTGFHPDLTGRENVYLNGAILGMKRDEITRKFDEIVDFAGVENFIDTPVKRYSSGMYVRLAFAVAAHLDPEILVVDEVLAVGDAEFQKKCLGKMGEVAHEGRTVLFVSHNMGSIQFLCSKVILINKGNIIFRGNVREGIDNYLASNLSQVEIPVSSRSDRRGDGPARLIDAVVLNHSGKKTNQVLAGEDVSFFLCIHNPGPQIEHAEVLITIYDHSGLSISHLNNSLTGDKLSILRGQTEIVCNIPLIPLRPGSYTINIALVQHNQYMDHLENVFRFSVLEGDYFGTGKMVPAYGPPTLIRHSWKVSDDKFQRRG